MQRPTRGEVTIVASAAVLLAISFLNLWARYDCPTCPAGRRWSRVALWSGAFSSVTKAAAVLAVLLALVIVVRVLGVRMPWSPGRVYVGIGALITLLLLVAMIAGPSDLGYGHTDLLPVTRGPLLWIAWLTGVGMVIGGLRHMRETASRTPAPGPGPVVLR